MAVKLKNFLIVTSKDREVDKYLYELKLYEVMDKGSVELIGPWDLEKALISLSKDLTKLRTGVVTSYALYILLGFIFYIWITSIIVYADSSL